MADILDFKKKQPVEYEEEMFQLYVSQDQDGALVVHMEVNDIYTDYEIYEAMMNATIKFGIDQEILVEDDTSTVH